jgi:thioredoxin reductase/NAD-dependent dihydropyrimidine dehydrogenase PreA subunit
MITFLVVVLGIILLGGLVIVAGLTLASVLRAGRAESLAAAAQESARALGALPPSLHPRVDLDRCIGSGACTEVCPEKDVLSVVAGKAAVTNPTACIGHGECLRACPVDAISLVLGSERRGVEIPLVAKDFQTNVPGLYVVGELGGMGLVYNAMTQALQAMETIVRAPPPRVEGVHQLLIVGAGPAGLAASLAAKKAGLDFVTVDQEALGGTVLHYPRFKIVMTKAVDLPFYGKLRLSEVKKEDLLAIWKQIAAKGGIEIRENVRVEKVARGEDGVFVVDTTGGTFRAQKVLLAMGRRGSPRKLDVLGEHLPKVVYRLLEPELFTGRDVLVVGGGDSAVEAAVSLAEAGAKVHLAHRGKAFDRIKPKNAQKLEAAKAKGSVTVLLEAQCTLIEEETVEIAVGGQKLVLDNDDLFVLVGGVLPTPFLEAAGVEVKAFKGERYAPANT